MKTTLIAIAFILASLIGYSQGTNYHKSYTTQKGTYVAPHVQTNPNGTMKDNYSTKGNYNPSTGKAGTATPTNTSGKNVQTGSRGGQYYYNSNGNKTYVKH